MTSSDQITKLKERNEQLQKQLEGSKKKVSNLQDKLKHTRSPPPLPKDSNGPDKDPGELEKKLQELTEKLAKRQEELRVARVERDEFAEQLRTLREKLVTSASSSPEGEDNEPEYDPETQKYKLSWVGDSLKDVGKKGPPAEKRKKSAGIDRRTTEEKMAAMAVEKQALEKGKPAQKVKKPREKPGRQTPPKADPEGEKTEKKTEKKTEEKKKAEEELEDTASYSVEELLERAEGSMDFDAQKDLKDPGAEASDGPTVPGVPIEEMRPEKSKEAEPEDSDVAVVTSDSGGRPVLRMHAVPDDEVAEPTLQESEESLVTERQEMVTDQRADEEVSQAFSDDDSEVMTEEKEMVEVPPPISKPLFARLTKVFSDHRALILKSLLFLAGAGLGVGLALLIFLSPNTKEPSREEGAGGSEEATEEPAEAPAGTKSDLAPAVSASVSVPDDETSGASAGTKSDLAPAELVEPIYQDAAIMDKKEAVKVGAALKAFVGKYPKDPLLRYHYARALYHKGDVDAAIKQLEESRKLDPDIPEVHYMLGGIYLRMGDEKKAHEALNNFTRLTGKPSK